MSLFFTGSVNAQCAGASCSDCTANSGCGWCAATQQCLDGSLTGPTSSICKLHSWYFAASNPCPDCASLEGCTACTDNDACGWVDSLGACASATDPAASAFCPCDEYEQCTDCTRGGCTFCTNNGKCQDAPDATCTNTSTCLCSAIASCDVCVEQDDICGWCAATSACTTLSDTTCASGEGDKCPEPSPPNELIAPLVVGWVVAGVFILAFIVVAILLFLAKRQPAQVA